MGFVGHSSLPSLFISRLAPLYRLATERSLYLTSEELPGSLVKPARPSRIFTLYVSFAMIGDEGRFPYYEGFDCESVPGYHCLKFFKSDRLKPVGESVDASIGIW